MSVNKQTPSHGKSAKSSDSPGRGTPKSPAKSDKKRIEKERKDKKKEEKKEKEKEKKEKEKEKERMKEKDKEKEKEKDDKQKKKKTFFSRISSEEQRFKALAGRRSSQVSLPSASSRLTSR